MAPRRIDSVLQGIAIQDRRLELRERNEDDELEHTQAGPRPGTAVGSDDRSTIMPQVFAAQNTDIRLRCIRGGDPKVGGGAWTYREATGEGDPLAWRGWNEPNLIRHFQVVEAPSASTWDYPCVVTVPRTGQVVVLASDTNGATSAGTFSWTRDPLTRTWGGASDVGAAAKKCAAFVLPETGRILAWLYGIDGDLDFASARYSDDAGESWSSFERDWVEGGLDADVDAFRVVRDRFGNFFMVAWDHSTGDVWFYVSTDGGHHFAPHPIVPSDGGFGRGFDLKLGPDGRIWMLFRSWNDSDVVVALLDDANVGDPTDARFQTEIVEGHVTAFPAQALVVDDDGAVYVVYSDVRTVDGSLVDCVEVARTADAGVSWVKLDYGQQYGHDWRPTSATVSGGEAVVVAPGVTYSGTTGGLLAVTAGGWENLEAGNDATFEKTWKRFGMGVHDGGSEFQRAAMPTAPFDDQGWTDGGATPPVWLGLSTLEQRFAPAASTSFYLIDFDDVASEAAFQFAGVRVTSGGDRDIRHCAIDVIRSDGVGSDRRLSICMDPTGFKVFDEGPGTAVELVEVDIDLTAPLDFLVTFSTEIGTEVQVWYRRLADARWTLAVDEVLTPHAPVAAQARVRVGCPLSTTATMFLLWAGWWRGHTRVGDAAEIVSGSNELRFGHALTTRPYPVRDQVDPDGAMMRLGARGRGARYDEAFTASVEYDFAAEKLLPTLAPSPSSGWRSTQTAENEVLTFDLGAGAPEGTRLEHGWLLCVALVGPRVPRLAQIEVEGDGVTTSLGTYDGATGFVSLSFVRVGAVLRANGGTPGARHCWGNEWAGGYVIFVGTGGETQRIRSSTPGVWDSTSGGAQLEIMLEDATGSTPTSGTLILVHPGGVFFAPVDPDVTYRYVRVTIPGNQPVPDDYFEVGNVLVGGVLVPGHSMGRGWSVRTVPQVSTREDAAGTTYIDKRGPARREFTWSYQEGNDLYAARQGVADYVSPHASLRPEAPWGDVYSRLHEGVQNADGGALPAVLLLAIPTSAGATTLTDWSLWAYGRIAWVPQANNVVGEPGEGEHYRAESLTFVELAWDPA